MTLTRPTKLLVLALTVLPLIYIALFVANVVYAVSASPLGDPLLTDFGILFGVHLAVMLLMMALLAFYVVFLFKSSDVRNDMKAVWAVVLLFGGPIAMPVFWYLYVWNARSNEAAGA